MRTLPLAVLIACPVVSFAQSAALPAADKSLQQALTGKWVGVLEYRDYSEPATSTKRVELPTWLTITTSGKSMAWQYIYDDGPAKILEETDMVTLDPEAKSYAVSSNGKPASVYTVDGYDKLNEGRGLLVLHRNGTDNDKPSEIRISMNIRRNLVEITEEVRPAGSSESFAFRHLFRFTRADPPAVTGNR